MTLFDDEDVGRHQGRPSGFLHEAPVGETDEWYTPAIVFDRLGLDFDLDPASPSSGPVPWVPARRFLSALDDGLGSVWTGRVWLNPPYSRVAPFLDRLAEHGDGIALTFARTDTRWFHRAVETAAAVTFVRDRLYFVRPNGSSGRPALGSLLLAWGETSAAALVGSDLGCTIRL